jgi:hypothetical protein
MAAPKFKNIILGRRWDDIRDAWLNYVPSFSGVGARPDPGLERLAPLQEVSRPDSKGRVADIAGVRANMLWEAIFLFQKCAHTHLAAQRLASMGMHSWSMFNAYHSAYIGARGVLAMLGIAFPYLSQSGQYLVDVFPPAESRKKVKVLAGREFQEMLLIHLSGHLDQQQLWEAFQRTLRVSDISVCEAEVCHQLLSVRHEAITKPRNAFLYKAAFWPDQDLAVDADDEHLLALLGAELDADATGFLLRLSCHVYRLFERLVADIAEQSGPIREQVNASRILRDPGNSDLFAYNAFLKQMGVHA